MSHGPITGDMPAISVGRRAHRARASPARCSPRTYERNWARLLAWNTPELRGDEYVIDEDVAKFAAKLATSGA